MEERVLPTRGWPASERPQMRLVVRRCLELLVRLGLGVAVGSRVVAFTHSKAKGRVSERTEGMR